MVNTSSLPYHFSSLFPIETPGSDRAKGFFIAHVSCALVLAGLAVILSVATGQPLHTLAVVTAWPALHLVLSSLPRWLPGTAMGWILPLGSLAAFTALVTGLTGGLTSPTLPWIGLIPVVAAVAGHRGLILLGAGISAAALGTIALLQHLVEPPLLSAEMMMAWYALSALLVTAFIAALAGGMVGALQRRRDALRHEQAQLKTITDNMPDVLMRFASDGRLVFISSACESVLGYDPRDLYGQSGTGLVHPDEATLLDDALRHGSQFGYDAILECRLRNRDGSFLWHELRCRAVLGGGDGEGLQLQNRPIKGRGPKPAQDRRVFDMIVVARDVSERKRYEHLLEQARDEAERSSLAKSRFLANMSHELRTPLNAIIGFSEVMNEEIFGPLGAKRYNDYAQYIHESGRHLLDLINDVLDLSKIEAGKYEPDLETVRVPMIVESCLKTIVFAARKGQVRLHVDLPADLPDLRADRRALRQIMLNLMANAVKFTPADGEVRIANRIEDDMFVIEVKDTGIGIPHHALSRIGQPFEQVGRLLQPRAEGLAEFGVAQPGTGLGLSIANSLAQLHGGWLEIESNEGKGTCARVYLPLNGPPEHQNAAPAPEPRVSRPVATEVPPTLKRVAMG